MKKLKPDLKVLLENLPFDYYVVDLTTKKIVQSNVSHIQIDSDSCHKVLFDLDENCELNNESCICSVLKNGKQVYENIIEKDSGGKKAVFKVTAKLLEENFALLTYTNITYEFFFKGELIINSNRLDSAERIADFGYWELNVENKTLLASKGARSIYGVDHGLLRLDEIQKIPLPEYRVALDLELLNLLRKQDNYDIKFRIKRPSDGQIRWIHSIAEFNASKNHVFGVIRDITETSEAISALNESELSLNQLFEHMNSAFAFHKIVKDQNGIPVDYIFLNVNSKFEELVGKKREEILNKSVLSVFPETEKYWIERYGKVATTGIPFNFMDYAKAIDGYFEVSAYSPKTDYFAVTFSNVTDKIKADKALKDSLTDLKLAHEISKLGNWKYNVSTKETIYSENIYKIFERNPEEGRISGDFMKTVLRDQYNDFISSIRNAFQNGIGFNKQFLLHLPGDKEKWIELICLPGEKIAEGQYFISGTLQDISESKKAELELHNSNLMLRTVIDNIPDAIYMKDANFRKLIANTGDARNSGVQRIEEIIGKSDFDVYPKEIAEIYTEDDKKVIINGEPVINREEILPAPGKNRWILTSKFPLKNLQNEIVGLVGIGRDITEIKEQQSRLGLLQQTIEHSPLSIVITDSDGNIEYVNPGFINNTGYQMEDVLGENPRILKSGFHEKEFYCKIWETITSGASWSGELYNRKKDGSYYWESAVITPILNEKREITNFVAIKEDITEKKQMVYDLQVAKEKAEESDRLKTLFLANMSHEIRTPLNGILGFSSLICSGENSEEKLNEYGRIIQNSGDRLITVIDDIIDISMIQSNQMKLNYEDFDINEMMEEMYVIYQNQKSDKLDKIKFSLQYCINKDYQVINSDKSRVYQIFKNLLDNAFKFTREGSIEFGCSDSTEKNIELFVRDTGLGIEKSKTKLIFESFRQADEGNSRKYDGSGLGLAIISGILEKMNGTIRVESELNMGSMFLVTLPRNNPGNYYCDEPEAKAEKAIEKADSGCIVSFEDDPASIEYLKVVVELLGYRLVNFVHAKDGIEYLKNNKAELVLMDVQLPEMNGYDATRIIKNQNPELPVIIQTAFAMKGDEERAIQAGSDDYITKPLNITILRDKISRLIHTKK